MTRSELIDAYARAAALDHECVSLVVTRKRAPRGRTVRVFAGVLGTVAGPLDSTGEHAGQYLVHVKTSDLGKHLAQRPSTEN